MSMGVKDMVFINNINSLNSNLVVTPMDSFLLITQKTIPCNKICNFRHRKVCIRCRHGKAVFQQQQQIEQQLGCFDQGQQLCYCSYGQRVPEY